MEERLRFYDGSLFWAQIQRIQLPALNLPEAFLQQLFKNNYLLFIPVLSVLKVGHQQPTPQVSN